MILVDSVYVNNSGGRILLDYLVRSLLPYENVYFLFDQRCAGSYNFIPSCRKSFLRASLKERDCFYRDHSDDFDFVLCFGNLAPTRRIRAKVFTYFHQLLYLNVPLSVPFKSRALFRSKAFVFGQLLRNTDYILVQSPNMARLCESKFRYAKGKLMVLPFFPDEDLDNYGKHPKGNLIYVSSGAAHKNHFPLIDAFCDAYDTLGYSRLTLTVSKGSNPKLEDIIRDKEDLGYPIRNIGFVDRDRLIDEYNNSEYLIFPSLEESFGLGLVEAIECGCKVIGADRPYTYQVCQPSIVFDPLDPNSICNAILKSQGSHIPQTRLLISNEIDRLVKLLTQ